MLIIIAVLVVLMFLGFLTSLSKGVFLALLVLALVSLAAHETRPGM